jgi:hypothetical protein
MAARFKIGDKVEAQLGSSRLSARIVEINPNPDHDYTIELDKTHFSIGWDCNGAVPSERGLWIQDKRLTPIETDPFPIWWKEDSDERTT